MPQHFANDVVRREQVTRDRELTVTPRVFNELSDIIATRLTLSATNSSMHPIISREPTQKLNHKRAKLRRRVTLFQHGRRDWVMAAGLLQTQLPKHAVKLFQLIRLKLEDLVFGHERRQAANVPRR